MTRTYVRPRTSVRPSSLFRSVTEFLVLRALGKDTAAIAVIDRVSSNSWGVKTLSEELGLQPSRVKTILQRFREKCGGSMQRCFVVARAVLRALKSLDLEPWIEETGDPKVVRCRLCRKEVPRDQWYSHAVQKHYAEVLEAMKCVVRKVAEDLGYEIDEVLV